MRTAPNASVHAFIFIQHSCVLVRTCVHICPDGRCAHTCTYAYALILMCVCVFKQACLFTFASPKTHSNLNAGDRTHLPALRAARQLSQNILYTHARIRLPRVPYMQRPGSAKWNFFKSQKHFPRTNQSA